MLTHFVEHSVLEPKLHCLQTLNYIYYSYVWLYKMNHFIDEFPSIQGMLALQDQVTNFVSSVALQTSGSDFGPYQNISYFLIIRIAIYHASLS